MASIQFYSEKISFKLSNPQKTARWLKLVCKKERGGLGELVYIFCSDGFLAKLNKRFLNHSTLTDIISFPDPDAGLIAGEIYISIPRVRENAKSFKQSFDTELRRVMVHGLLHFLGYHDKKPAEKARMREKEEAYLSLWA